MTQRATTTTVSCPNCGHDIGDHWESGEDVDPGCDRGYGRPADGSPCPCRYSPTYIYRALLAERDAKLDRARLVVASLNMTDRGTSHNHRPGEEHEDCAGCWAESIAEALSDRD